MGKKPQRGLPEPRERAQDLGNAGGERASPSPTRQPDPCAILAISIACCASAVAGPGPERRDHRHRHTPRSVPGGSETYCSGEKHNQSPFFPCLLTARALLPRNAEFSFLNFSEMQ